MKGSWILSSEGDNLVFHEKKGTEIVFYERDRTNGYERNTASAVGDGHI